MRPAPHDTAPALHDDAFVMRGQRGQTTAEYLGGLLVVSVVIAAVATTEVGASIRVAMSEQVCRIGGGTGCGTAQSPSSSPDALSHQAEVLDEALDALEPLAGRGGLFADLHEQARAALDAGDLSSARALIDQLEFYDGFIEQGPRGGLLAELNAPTEDEFEDLVDERDISVDGGETSRRFFTVDPVPGRGVVAFDFFIPSENSNGFRGDGRPEEGTDILNTDLGLNESRVMIVIDYETGRAVIVQSETHMDGPWGVGGANEPRPISLNGDRGAWDNMGGIDLDMTNQIDLESTDDGLHVDWDILNSISPLIISVDGDVDFEEGEDGFLTSDDFTNQGRVDRYPQIQVWQYRPDGTSREIARNDYQGGHNPVQGALPHCDLPNGPDLPTIGIGDFHVWDMPDLPDGPSVPGPC